MSAHTVERTARARKARPMSTVEAAGKSIRSTIPARLDRLSWSPFHTPHGRGPGRRVDPRRAPDHDRELGHGRAHPARHARHDLDRGRADRVDLPGRTGGRRARTSEGSPTSSAQAAADRHAAPVPVRHRARRVHGERRRLVLARLVLRHPVHRGDGDRRPVRGDQLRDRRDDALEVPRPRRHLDQRHLLGRRDPRLVRLSRLPQRVRAERRLAARVPAGSRARARRDRRRRAPCPRAPAGS